MSVVVILVLAVVYSRSSEACKSLMVYSELLGSLQFDMSPSIPESWFDEELGASTKPAYSSTGRQIYISNSRSDMHKTHFLYHVEFDGLKGEGRWVISTEFNARDHAVAYIESWAVTPLGIEVLKDKSDSKKGWEVARMPPSSDNKRVSDKPNYFTHDESFRVMCKDDGGSVDRSIYFDSSPTFRPELAGFYVETAHPYKSEGFQAEPAVYAHIKANADDQQQYLFLLGEDTWMIGDVPGVDSGLAFVKDKASHPDEIKELDWRYVGDERDDFSWMWGDGTIVSRNMEYTLIHYDMELKGPKKEVKRVESGDIHEALRSFRSIKHVPVPQSYAVLHNGIPMPWVGLGTGGIFHEELKSVLTEAFARGYRMLDSAREYRNEGIIADTIRELRNGHFDRRDVFIISKVWPTQLGVGPTRRAVTASLRELKSNYVDMYLLHWPACDATIDWMHCQDIELPGATWQQSWKALEREYAEGRVMSIGVSNFAASLLSELDSLSTVLPHLVQNHAELGVMQQDTEVRRWCDEHGVIYQPYAHQRNLQFLDSELQETLNQISHMSGKSKHTVASKFFLQSGASVVPRSRNHAHLAENIDLWGWELQAADMLELGFQQKKRPPTKSASSARDEL